MQTAQRAADAGLPIGLHLNLTEGPPTASVDKVSSLVESQTPWWPSGDSVKDGSQNQVLHMRGKNGLREALTLCKISMEDVGREVAAFVWAVLLVP